MEQRISYKLLPGSGDDGVSKLNCCNMSKADPLNDFYYFSEELMIAIADAKLFGEYSNESCSKIFDRLEQAIPSLNAFYYLITQKPTLKSLDQYSFREDHLNKINFIIKDLHPTYGGSKEFQVFSNDKNIHYLNKIRVKVRRLELQYKKSLELLTEDINLSSYTLTVSKVLNRLSSLIWDLMLKEQIDNNVTPQFWQGSMPDFDF